MLALGKGDFDADFCAVGALAASDPVGCSWRMEKEMERGDPSLKIDCCIESEILTCFKYLLIAISFAHSERMETEIYVAVDSNGMIVISVAAALAIVSPKP